MQNYGYIVSFEVGNNDSVRRCWKKCDKKKWGEYVCEKYTLNIQNLIWNIFKLTI